MIQGVINLINDSPIHILILVVGYVVFCVMIYILESCFKRPKGHERKNGLLIIKVPARRPGSTWDYTFKKDSSGEYRKYLTSEDKGFNRVATIVATVFYFGYMIFQIVWNHYFSWKLIIEIVVIYLLIAVTIKLHSKMRWHIAKKYIIKHRIP